MLEPAPDGIVDVLDADRTMLTLEAITLMLTARVAHIVAVVLAAASRRDTRHAIAAVAACQDARHSIRAMVVVALLALVAIATLLRKLEELLGDNGRHFNHNPLVLRALDATGAAVGRLNALGLAIVPAPDVSLVGQQVANSATRPSIILSHRLMIVALARALNVVLIKVVDNI